MDVSDQNRHFLRIGTTAAFLVLFGFACFIAGRSAGKSSSQPPEADLTSIHAKLYYTLSRVNSDLKRQLDHQKSLLPTPTPAKAPATQAKPLVLANLPDNHDSLDETH